MVAVGSHAQSHGCNLYSDKPAIAQGFEQGGGFGQQVERGQGLQSERQGGAGAGLSPGKEQQIVHDAPGAGGGGIDALQGTALDTGLAGLGFQTEFGCRGNDSQRPRSLPGDLL